MILHVFWYSCDTILIHVWYYFDTCVILSWYTCDTSLIHMWYSFDTHVILFWYTCDTSLIHVSYIYLSITLKCTDTCNSINIQDNTIRLKTKQQQQKQLPLSQLFVGKIMSYLRYLCLFVIVVSNTYCVVLCTLCCQFLWIVRFWLPLRYSLTFISWHLSLIWQQLPFFYQALWQKRQLQYLHYKLSIYSRVWSLYSTYDSYVTL